ncbi:vacuolar protein 8-like [Ipomoea triloba]|uniref:vacuolar protein 8-like n=1 Tax=Ipomoea triloba TaxID=35885 RepID=UPI00125D99AE|nr:vacuolar protein 8-like [Ipomoea triloba]
MKVAEEHPNGPITPLLSNTQLLQSLVDSIPRAQSFRGKWGLIRTKLSSLDTHLSELSPSAAAASVNSGISAEILRSVSVALSDALCISIRCQSSTPHGGKLRTQNDIDSVSAKLDNLNRDLEVLNRSGVLNESGAVSSKRETVRAESRSLITRLQIGTAESKNSALDSLLGLLYEEDKNVLIAVAQGIVPVLVRVLDSTSSWEVKEKTVAAIAKISTVDSSKRVLIAEGSGLLHNLLRIIESGSVVARESSCIALQTLSHSKENARAIGSRGGISSLLQICETGTPHCQAMAASVLKNLALFPEIKEHFVEGNATTILLGLSNSGTTLAQENAIACLSNLISGDDDNLKLLVAKEGGIESLKNFWDSAPSLQSLESPIQMVGALSSCPLIAGAIVENGFLSRIVGVLSCGVLGVRIAAARALYEITAAGYSGSRTRKQLGEMGCIPPLVAMLEAKATAEKDAAARALSSLLIWAGNRRIFKKEEKGIVSVVQLLDPVTHRNVDKRHPISILSSLAHSKEWRKQMAAAGTSGQLQKLAEMNVDGAKKLLDCLGRSKLWVVFSRP